MELYNELFSINWSFLSDIKDANTDVAAFYDILFALVDRHALVYKNHKRKFPVWYTSEIINKIKLKEKYRKKFKNTGRPEFESEFEE